MKTAYIIGLVAALVVLAAIPAFAHSGYGMWQTANSDGPTQDWHDAIEGVLEEGTYEEFVQLQDEYGPIGPPWVVDEPSFALWQQRHERMESVGGMHRGHGMHGFGGCPMMG